MNNSTTLTTPDVNTKPAAQARLMRIHANQSIAVSTSAALEMLDFPTHLKLPGGAPYSYGIFNWQGHWVPLIDLHAFIHKTTTQLTHTTDKTTLVNSTEIQTTPYVLVMTYVAQSVQKYIAIALTEIPKTISVHNESACSLPQNSERWAKIARACIVHDNNQVPIVSPHLLAECHISDE